MRTFEEREQLPFMSSFGLTKTSMEFLTVRTSALMTEVSAAKG